MPSERLRQWCQQVIGQHRAAAVEWWRQAED